MISNCCFWTELLLFGTVLEALRCINGWFFELFHNSWICYGRMAICVWGKFIHVCRDAPKGLTRPVRALSRGLKKSLWWYAYYTRMRIRGIHVWGGYTHMGILDFPWLKKPLVIRVWSGPYAYDEALALGLTRSVRKIWAMRHGHTCMGLCHSCIGLIVADFVALWGILSRFCSRSNS